MPIDLALIIHAHQPVGNFDWVIEASYQNSYLPFLTVLERHTEIRLALHYSGFLLDWLEDRHPEYGDRLRTLLRAGRIELLGGGYYEPILVAIPDHDKAAQLQTMAASIERRFGAAPQGIWLAERVWEPQLPSALAASGVQYAVIDDTHLRMAGVAEDRTYGYYLSEHDGKTVRLLPSNKSLRYMIPFRPEEETLHFLEAAAVHVPAGLVTMGDDLEKFGSWPHTYDHVYRDGWLERFFTLLESRPDTVRTTLPSRYLAERGPLGRIYLPTASYAEMMEWALPLDAAEIFHRALNDPATEPYRQFLAGGVWRNFLVKYRESNHLQKRVNDASERLRAEREPRNAAAERHLLAAQCNDTYWHGIFGGLYAPHLRDAAYGHLLEAEELFGCAGQRQYRIADLNLDGAPEVVVRSPDWTLVAAPADGGCIEELDLRAARVNLINSLQRRPEIYHHDFPAPPSPTDGPPSIHDLARGPQPGNALLYDRYPRSAFRAYLFAEGKTFGDYERLALEESPGFSGGVYEFAELDAEEPGLRLWREDEDAGRRLRLEKRWILGERAPTGARLACDVQIDGEAAPGRRLGVEVVVNFLAPDAPDRYVIDGVGARQPLRWGGEVPGPALTIADEWRKLKLELHAEGAAAWWVAPIFTLSRSESGFEQVYQGSALLAVWPATAGVVRRVELIAQFDGK